VTLLFALVACAAWARPSAPRGPGDECLSCHTEWAGKKVVHPPVKNGLCLGCHASASETEHTFSLRADGKALCAQCHSTRDTRKVLHAPVTEGLCLNCHDPHGSDFHARLRKNVFDTCTSCHPSKRMQNDAATTRHGALDEAQNPRVCVACHDAHQSDYERRLVAWPPMNVCFQCHDKEQKTPAGDALMDMKSWVGKHERVELRHGPVREGRCPDCHEPHGTSDWRILKGAYPGTPYAPLQGAETYGICFRCHDSRLVLAQTLNEKAVSNADPSKDLSPTKLPQGERLVRAGLTGFRNGNENLHFRHVNKFDKGRPCRMCHDVHASENPKHIRTSTPFGGWEFKLNYKKTTTGGSCWPGCHVERSYDRDQRKENPR
jgi:predicted CXXCH cytochrome family protein